MNTIIFITKITREPDFSVLSGMLLDETNESSLPYGPFSALLASDRVVGVRCERPKFAGGHGTTPDGLFVTEFETSMSGKRTFVESRTDTAGIYDILENRVRLVTTDYIEPMTLPAFLGTGHMSSPRATLVTLALEVRVAADLPDFKAFAHTDSYILRNAIITHPLRIGTMLPARRGNRLMSSLCVLELREPATRDTVDAVVYTQSDETMPIAGEVLKRNIRVSNPRNRTEILQFDATIGTIVHVA